MKKVFREMVELSTIQFFLFFIPAKKSEAKLSEDKMLGGGTLSQTVL